MITDLLPWKKKNKSNDVPVKRNDSNDSPFSVLHQKINNLFDDFFDDSWDLAFPHKHQNWGMTELNPQFDVTETADRFEITAEIAGIDKDKLDVSIDHNILTVKGEKNEEKKEKRKDYHVSERRYGTFRRSFALPEGVDIDNLKADFKKGVLKISMPKTEEAKKNVRKIAINE